jgi:uncharacterized protein (DUF342 family)
MDKNPSDDQPAEDNHAMLFGSPNGGNLIIRFSELDMEVHADFIPPIVGGNPLAVDEITSILQKINVTYGIHWDTIQETLLESTLERRRIEDVLIARGDPPVNEVAEYFELSPVLARKVQMREKGGRIDHRARSPFIIVKKDQTLAAIKPRKPGKEGKDVHGNALPFPVVRPDGVKGGENTRTEEGHIFSNISGQLIEDKKEKVLHVLDNLVIKGSVGYTTGHIVFPGDVEIEGPVLDGFKIYSGGSVSIKQTLDVTEVITKGDLTVAGGVIGKNAGLLKVGGGIRTKFIENCRAAARKAVIVDTEIHNSSVFTLEHVEMGDKGLILGSEIYAVHGGKASGIGKKAGKATRIHCGIDFTAQQEKEKNTNLLGVLAVKLSKLKEMMADQNLDPEKRSKMEELQRSLEEDQKKASQRISELLGVIITDENAVVEISGEISRGTLIEICQTALFLDEPVRKVRIRLDKMAGKLVCDPLK